jgi:hypothetical protein
LKKKRTSFPNPAPPAAITFSSRDYLSRLA